jgi:hypothetical protein
MSVYAVYARTPHGAHWDLCDVCESQEEADRRAGAVVGRDGAKAASDEAYAESLVVAWERRDDVPAHLPVEQAVGVTARYMREGEYHVD